MTNLILISTIGVGGLGLLFGFLLALASRIFAVQIDERIKMIEEILPGANCGACGYPGCAGYAKAIIENQVDITLCAPGGLETANRIAKILGTERKEIEKKIAKVRCVGDKNTVKRTGNYQGIKSCVGVQIAIGGDKECIYGCLGYGDCVKSCPFDAIYIDKTTGLPVVIESKCTGCGLCVKACPRNIIELVPESAYMFIKCVSKDFGPAVSKVCKKGCIGCGICVKLNNNQGIEMKENLPVIDYKNFKGDKTASEKCPTKVIEFIEKKYKKYVRS
jgi:electron transport complex protein RnfB